MKVVSVIIAEAAEANLPFIVIGGLAVAAYGHSRMTLDADFMVPRRDLAAWDALLLKFGYEKFHDQAGFAQFRPPLKEMWPVDLMLVNDETFSKIMTAAEDAEIANRRVKIPSPLHLTALKLHALRHGKPERQAQDFNDIVEVLRLQRVDVSSETFRVTCEKYGTLELYDRIRRSLPSGA